MTSPTTTETANDPSQRLLAGIIALLLSLAGRATRASQKPFPIRALTLWFMRPAEAAMCAWFAGAGGLCGKRTAQRYGALFDDPGFSVDYALRLAARFHAMAKALQRMQERFTRRLNKQKRLTDSGLPPRDRWATRFQQSLAELAHLMAASLPKDARLRADLPWPAICARHPARHVLGPRVRQPPSMFA